MRKEILSLTGGTRRTLILLAALLVGMALLFGLGTRTAQTQTASPTQTTYKVQDLGTLGGTDSVAWDINDSGQVVGKAATSSSSGHAFLYDKDQNNGQMQDLGHLGGAYSYALGINDSGQVVGSSRLSSGGYGAFLYTNGQMQDLGSLGGTHSSANGINNSGQVVGESSTASSGPRAFLYDKDQNNGQMQDLGSLEGTDRSTASDINNFGQVVGHSTISNNTHHAFLYSNGQMQGLGTLGGTHSVALGINNSGQVAGWASTTSSGPRAFLKEDGQPMQSLGTLGGDRSSARDINDSGQVVGYSTTSSGSDHAFLYSNGQMTDLNTLIPANSGWTLERATAINSAGQIAAIGYKDGVGTRALLLTPSETTVPELLVKLKDQVTSLGLSAGVNTSLQAKLNDALAAANAGDTATACTALSDFISEVQALSGKRGGIRPADAQNLIASANEIKAVLGC